MCYIYYAHFFVKRQNCCIQALNLKKYKHECNEFLNNIVNISN